jgi:hypothetical protein
MMGMMRSDCIPTGEKKRRKIPKKEEKKTA